MEESLCLSVVLPSDRRAKHCKHVTYRQCRSTETSSPGDNPILIATCSIAGAIEHQRPVPSCSRLAHQARLEGSTGQRPPTWLFLSAISSYFSWISCPTGPTSAYARCRRRSRTSERESEESNGVYIIFSPYGTLRRHTA